MGAWGLGPFENDGAGDLVAEVRHGDFSFEETAEAFEDPSYLEVDGGQIAIALGALVRVTRGELAPPEPDLDLTAFAAQLTPERLDWIRAQMNRAFSDSDSSEIYELWEEAESLDEWLEISRANLP